MAGGTPGTDTPGTDRRLLHHDVGAWRLLVASVACGVAATGIVVASAVVISDVVARVFIGGETITAVAPVLLAAVALTLTRAALVTLQEALAQRGSGRLRSRLRADLTSRLIEDMPGSAGRDRTGDVVATVTSGLDDIDAWMADFQPARALAVLSPVVVLAAALLVDPPSALVMVLTGPVLVLLLVVIGGRTRAVTQRRFTELRWLSAYFLDMLQGLRTLKLFGRSREQVVAIGAMSAQYGATTMDVLRTAFQTTLVLEWGAAVATAVVAVEVSLRLIDGLVPFERALAVLVITPEFFLPLRQLAIRYHAGAAGRTAATRVFEVLDDAPPAVDMDRPARPPYVLGRPMGLGEVRFDGVWFGYPGMPSLLRDLTLTLRPGTLVALIGGSGAGKTTCASLLLGFLEPQRGRILIGDTPLTDIERHAWLASVAWVPQRPHLFHGTIADNIRLSRPDASDEAVERAARDANAAGFIEALPQGYLTEVGEDGQRLSGGQRQRVAVARAFLKDAPLVILDEPTSHLDVANEAVVGDAIRRLAVGRTVLLISHRSGLTAIADEVLELADGRMTPARPMGTERIATGPALSAIHGGTAAP